jgi:hypothetical protein
MKASESHHTIAAASAPFSRLVNVTGWTVLGAFSLLIVLLAVARMMGVAIF